jgi:hypothetical protein
LFRGLSDSIKIPASKFDKLFFFYPQKTIGETNEGNKKFIEQLIDECEKLARQCDELKVNDQRKFSILRLSSLFYSSYYQNQNHREHQVQLNKEKV